MLTMDAGSVIIEHVLPYGCDQIDALCALRCREWEPLEYDELVINRDQESS